jgi:hypothetical protein
MVAQDGRRSHRWRLLGYTGLALFGFVLISNVLVWGSGKQKGGKEMGYFAGDLRWFLRKRNKGPLEIKGKGLPAYGLTVVALNDPQYNDLMADFFGDNPPELVKIAAPTTVFLINESDKALVAYDLTYDFRAADGTVNSNDYSPIFMPALIDWPQDRLAEDQAVVIPPGRARLISPLFGFGGLSKGQLPPSYGNESDEKRLKKQMMSAVKLTLEWTASLTITLDGVFFEDGSFVGPDASEFFENTQATITARRDILEWFVEAVRKRERKGESPDIVFSELEAMVKEMPRGTSQGSPADFYKDAKLGVAQEMLRMRDRIGAARVILEKKSVLETKWPVAAQGWRWPGPRRHFASEEAVK